MKRLTIGLTATAIITLGVFAFTGCEKEESKVQSNYCESCSKASFNLEEELNELSNYFMNNYGIDIHILASNSNFQELITETNNLISDMIDTVSAMSENELENAVQFLNEKRNQFVTAKNDEDTLTMLSIAESLKPYVCGNKPSETFTFQNQTFSFPTSHFTAYSQQAHNLLENLKQEFPTIAGMDEQDLAKLLEAGFNASLLDENNGLCFDKGPSNGSNNNSQTKEDKIAYEKCIQKAKSDYAIHETIQCGAATGKLISMATLNAIPGVGTAAYVVTIVETFAEFGYSTYSGYKEYQKDIEICKLKFHQA